LRYLAVTVTVTITVTVANFTVTDALTVAPA